ncbi:MAG: valine--tRNA ligase [Candidatus Colwellbacteria bacterium]|nr:valine--tRNA ligase [Candidatus Colwellbacteria bacterium]
MGFMETRFDHKQVEPKIYQSWEKSGFFNPDKLPAKGKPFTIIMPPPNANGSLHIGHALFVTLEDIMIRFWRMRGRKTLWLPGADHAGFETQVVFDKKIEKEGRNRFKIPREKLWQELWRFTQENKKIMEGQLRSLGASCDWSREKFTLDPDIIEKTQETFIKMYEAGLVYRGRRLVNWCVKHQTALSDLEVSYIERKDPLYYIKYGPFTLATVRPETKFGDTAVAVHPGDKRYQKYIGKEIEAEDLLGPIKLKVIADEAVDPHFGTGVVKVTPAHDPTDFEIGLRHKLEVRQVIDKFGRLNEKTGRYRGLKVAEAREKVASDLKERGLIKKIDEKYVHSIATCYKCGSVLEPLLLPQWFIKMEGLAREAIKVAESGKIKFYPERLKKVYLHWLKNIRDWNISRQIIWGIRIPAWHCECEPENWRVGTKAPRGKCPRCRSSWTEDPDVFDTWFSSGQWPFLSLGYPKSRDYKTFYPTDVMETGWDILFFWVARMIMLGLYRTGKIPFKVVYLHGLVRDKDRQKMSKSKGNVIDPLGVADIYGTDAVRMALTIGSLPGNDPIISEDKIRGYRNFTTKIWNASRFVVTGYDAKLKVRPRYSPNDRRHQKQLAEIKKRVTKDIENFRFHHAAETIYHYFWHTFADKIIEESKSRLGGENEADKAAAQETLLKLLKESLKMLHPFMPFVTEEIWQRLPRSAKAPRGKPSLLMVEKW